MFPRARVRPGAEETPEDEEASLLQQRDLTLRSALDQIQQRRRTPAPRHTSPPRQPPQEPVPQAPTKDSPDMAPAVPAPPPPHPQGGPLEALRQREWLLNLQEQQELQRLKAATPPEQVSRDKEEQLLFNGESPPSPPPVVPQAERLPLPPPAPFPPARSLGRLSSRGSSSWRGSGQGSRGSRGSWGSGSWGSGSWGSGPPRAPRGRGAPRRSSFHHHRGNSWPPHIQQRRESMAYSYGQGRRPPHSRPWEPPCNELGPPAKNEVRSSHPHPSLGERLGGRLGIPVQEDDHASLRSMSSNSSRHPREEGPAETDWQERALPRSAQDEAFMLAQALELSRLDDGLSCSEEEHRCGAALEQSRREHRGGRRGTRGGPHRPPPRWDNWRSPMGLPGDLLTLGNELGIVGSIDVQQATHLTAASGREKSTVAPSPCDAAEPAVSFDLWLSMCSRYMPLLAQGMVELQRTCAAVRSMVPAFDGGPIPFPPPVWPPPLQFPPTALSPTPPNAALLNTPPPGMAPLSVALQTPVASSPKVPPPPMVSHALAPTELSTWQGSHQGQPPRLVTNGGGDGGQTSDEAGPRQKNSTQQPQPSLKNTGKRQQQQPGNTEQPNTSSRGRRPSRHTGSKKKPANS